LYLFKFEGGFYAEAMVKLFDTNKDGTLDHKELGHALKKRGVEKRRAPKPGVRTTTDTMSITASVVVAPAVVSTAAVEVVHANTSAAPKLARAKTELAKSGGGNQGIGRGRNATREQPGEKRHESVGGVGSKHKTGSEQQPKTPQQPTLDTLPNHLRPEPLSDSLKQRVNALTSDPAKGSGMRNAIGVGTGKQGKSGKCRSLSHERRAPASDPNAKPPSLRQIVDRTVLEIGENDKNVLSTLKRMDDNGSGFISAEDARAALRSLNATLSVAEADMMIRSFDSQSKDKVVCTLDYCEFSRMVKRRHAQLLCAGLDKFFGMLVELTDRLGRSAMQILTYFDTHHRGFLFSEELVGGLAKLGVVLTVTEIELIKKRFGMALPNCVDSVPNSVDPGGIYRALGRFRVHVREREPRISPSKSRALSPSLSKTRAHASPPRPSTGGSKAANRVNDPACGTRPMTAPSRAVTNSRQTALSGRANPKVRAHRLHSTSHFVLPAFMPFLSGV
jgi:Ca2+-binding EF-hand superfamily protein